MHARSGSLKKALILSGLVSIAAMCSVAACRSLSFVLHGTRVSMACFQVSIEFFIGVQLWGVAGQVEDFDLLEVLCQPLLDRRAVMHAQVIEHQEDLAPCLLDRKRVNLPS